MDDTTRMLQDRVSRLERSVLRTRAVAGAALLGAAALALGGLSGQPGAEPGAVQDEVRTRKLVVLDDQDVARVVIMQDPPGGQRRSRAAGITIRDHTGVERGGMGTMDDGSAVMALDAPHGVGAPMPDRAGMIVWPDGSADIALFDNAGRTAVDLHSDGERGSLLVLKWAAGDEKGQAKSLSFDGEEVGPYKGFGPGERK